MKQTLCDQPTFQVDSEVDLEFGRCRRDSCGGFSNSSTIDAERHIRHGMQLIKVVYSFFIPRSREGHKRSGLPNWIQMQL